jgi:hypothetical protein
MLLIRKKYNEYFRTGYNKPHFLIILYPLNPLGNMIPSSSFGMHLIKTRITIQLLITL